MPIALAAAAVLIAVAMVAAAVLIVVAMVAAIPGPGQATGDSE